MSKIELKEGIFIEGSTNLKYFYGLETWLSNHRGIILYKDRTSEIPEEIAKSCVKKSSEPITKEGYKNYFKSEPYWYWTAKESIQSACPEEYCIIYKTK